MNRNAIITGITGQDGSYLAELLIEKQYNMLYGLIRRSSNFNTNRIDHIIDHPKLILKYSDLTDIGNLMHIIKTASTGCDRLEIYNLGAMSHVKISFEIPSYTYNVNALGIVNILECVRALDIIDKTRIYQASTSEMFGNTSIPQNENTIMHPCSPYGAAKHFAYNMTKIYRESYGMFIGNGILFNHESPRRGNTFVSKKIINGVKKYIQNPKSVLKLGNIYSKRDWGHAKDYVHMMWLIIQHDIPDDFVISSNFTLTVKEFVNKAFNHVGIDIEWKNKGIHEIAIDSSNGNVVVAIDEKYFREFELNTLFGDSSKAENILGWKRQYNIDTLIEDMFSSEN
jgi:GDPmannose 4,6-dehydratase